MAKKYATSTSESHFVFGTCCSNLVNGPLARSNRDNTSNTIRPGRLVGAH
jgi:hypothetical protein